MTQYNNKSLQIIIGETKTATQSLNILVENIFYLLANELSSEVRGICQMEKNVDEINSRNILNEALRICFVVMIMFYSMCKIFDPTLDGTF